MPAPTLLPRSLPSSTSKRHPRELPAYVAALAGCACLLLVGCRPPVPVAPPNTPVFVRLPALLPIHPAWAEVRELDALIAHTAGLNARGASSVGAAGLAGRAGIALSEAPMPPPLQSGNSTLQSRPPSLEGVTRAAASRIDRLRESLDTHVERIVDRERRERMERAAADIAAKRADLLMAAGTAPLEAGLSPEDRKELRRLQFLDIAFENQAVTLLPPARADALAKWKDVRKQIAAIETKAPKPGEELQARIDNQVAEYRKTRIAEMERELAGRRTALQSQTTQRIQPYRQRLAAVVAPPPPPSAAAGGQSGEQGPAADRIASPREVASFERSAAPELPAAAATARLRDQRERLAQTIASEIRTRLAAISATRRWTVSLEPRAGYIDVTDQAASALRSEIQSGSASVMIP